MADREPGAPERRVEALGTVFQNPVLLAAGTCGFGREMTSVVDLEQLGGFVTKSVTLEPRAGNPAPRVTEIAGGMLNSVGLANPGLERVRSEELPWIEGHVRRARVLVSLAGHSAEEFEALVEGLDGGSGFVAFEINLSCPNDARRRAMPFALDPEAAADVMCRCRARTGRPLVAKLAPASPALAETVAAVEEAGADAFTLVNTLPGLALDSASGSARLGAGRGGLSGPAIRAAGLLAVSEARTLTELPIFGVGGISSTEHALAYLRAGASLVQVGTASFADPRTAERIARDLVPPPARRTRDSASSEVSSAGARSDVETPWPA